MMKMTVAAIIAASLAHVAAAGSLDVVMDGKAAREYGSALIVQNTQTQFGDSNLGQIGFANGSELDQGFGFISLDSGYLYIVLAGNLESNFNKLEVFIDFKKGGQNRLRGDNPDVDFNGLNRMGDDGSGNGLTFDADFAADYYITATCGGTPSFSTFANTAEILTLGGGSGGFIGSGGEGTSFLNGSNGVLIAIDNSNTRGVSGGNGTASGKGVSTGVEIAIPLSLLSGYTSGDIKVCAAINGGGHDFLSNQILGGIGGGNNLGEPRAVNFDFAAGNQYFVVPGPIVDVFGDLNGDGFVDAADLAILLGEWGAVCTAGCTADLNGDGTVDAADLALLLGAWS